MARDENGKYIHYEVVEKSPVPADSLSYRAKAFLRTKKLNNIRQKDDQLLADGKTVINKTAFVLTHPSGEISYTFSFESKEGRYRFWLTNFLFIPYNRDRYGNFVATTAKGIPLENNPGKLNAAEWASYIEAAAKHADAVSAEFKRYLSATPKIRTSPEAPKTISTKNW